MNAKMTLYLEPKVQRAVKVRAAQMGRTASDLANELIKRGLDQPGFVAAEGAQWKQVGTGAFGLPVFSCGHPLPTDWLPKREDLYD